MTKKISEFLGKTLYFKKDSIFKNTYTLMCETEILGKLHIKNIFSMRALVKDFQKEDIEFYKPHFFSNEIHIRFAEYILPFATYKNKLFALNGSINLQMGNQLLVKYNLFGTRLELQDNYNEPIIKQKSKIFYPSAKIEIIKKSELVDKNPWIIALLFYVMLLRKNKNG